MAATYRPPESDAAALAAVAAEAATRAGADTTLTTAVAAEATARAGADSTLTTAVGTKATTAALTSETNARIAADVALQTQVDAVESGSGAAPVLLGALGNSGAAFDIDTDGAADVWQPGIVLNAAIVVATITGLGDDAQRIKLIGKQDATGDRVLRVDDGTGEQAVGISTDPDADFEICADWDGDKLTVYNAGGSGPAGPTGPQGPQGDQGIQGTPGTGMANPMLDVGDLILGGTAGAPTRLAAPASSPTTKFLRGDGTFSAIPAQGGRLEATRPASAVCESMPRILADGLLGIMSSGLLRVTIMQLKAGETVSALTFETANTAGATLAHRWVCLIRVSDRAVLGKSADDTSASWAAFTRQTFTLTASYTASADELVYAGLVVVGTTVPNLLGRSMASNGLAGVAPILAGWTGGSYTDPASLGGTANTVSSPNGGHAYVYAT